MIVEEVVIDRYNNVDITLALPIGDDSPEPGSPKPESTERRLWGQSSKWVGVLPFARVCGIGSAHLSPWQASPTVPTLCVYH